MPNARKADEVRLYALREGLTQQLACYAYFRLNKVFRGDPLSKGAELFAFRQVLTASLVGGAIILLQCFSFPKNTLEKYAKTFDKQGKICDNINIPFDRNGQDMTNGRHPPSKGRISFMLSVEEAIPMPTIALGHVRTTGQCPLFNTSLGGQIVS